MRLIEQLATCFEKACR